MPANDGIETRVSHLGETYGIPFYRWLMVAHLRLEFLLWDPTPGSLLQPWSAMSLPISLKWLNSDTSDSSWATCLNIFQKQVFLTNQAFKIGMNWDDVFFCVSYTC